MELDLILTSIKLTMFKSPLYIIWIVGIVMTVVYSEKHGKNARLFLIVVVGLFIIDVINLLFNTSFIILVQTNMDTQMISYIISAVNFVLVLIDAILWGLLIYLFLAKTRPKTAEDN